MEFATPCAPHARDAEFARWTAWFVVGGAALRLLLYGLAFPVWGDEAFVAANFLDGNWRSLAGPLIAQQVAPLLFLWGEFAAYRWFGPSEWALRLLPELAGLAALFLFWRLARRELPPRAALFAVAFLAMAYEPVRLAALAKPYSFDLLAAVVLLHLGLAWRRRPERRTPLAALAVAGPLAMFCSYPAAFVAGGVGLALAPTALRRDRRAAGLLLAFAALTLAAFAAHYFQVGKAQADSGAGAARQGLVEYWRRGFPPDRAADWPWWLLQAHIGQTVGYPLGDRNGGSLVTALLAAAGAVGLWRDRRRTLLAAALAPFALNFAAACAGKYPYGEGVRLAQHLAPAICLLAGAGMSRLLGAFPPARRHAALRNSLIALAAIGVGQAAWFVARPFRDDEAQWLRSFSRQLSDQIRPGDQAATPADREFNGPLLWWHAAAQGADIRWHGAVDWPALERDRGRLWLLDYRVGNHAEPRPDFAAAILAGHPGWTARPSAGFFVPGPGGAAEESLRLDVWLATRPGAAPPRPWVAWPGR